MYYAVVYPHTFITTVVLFSFNSFDSFFLLFFSFSPVPEREKKRNNFFDDYET
jgi:hypothetical protein